MSDWSHGYNVSLGYTYGFYRELAPDWLDFCAHIAGYAAPNRRADGGLRYLELGSGQGFGLCLLAAANPQGEFIGVDFNPEHIAHSRALAEAGRLANVRFVEGDFNLLAQDWPADFGQFDYVVLHGIYSWVPPQVRRALVACLDNAVRPGGMVYVSYNAKPGWLPTTPFQHLARRMQVVRNKPGPAAIEEAVALFDRFAEANAAIYQALPGLKGRVDSVRKQNRNYLVQEYLHEHWHPLWFSEVCGEFAEAKLNHVGSATVAELLLPGLLPEASRELINSEPDLVLRQEIQDCAINQSFRRDIFCRGARRNFQHRFQAAMHAVFHLIAVPDATPLKVSTTFGELAVKDEYYRPMLDALAQGPKRLEELLALPGIAEHGLATGIQSVVLLLQANAVGVGRIPGNAVEAQALNATLARLVCDGAPYGFLATPATGGAMPASDIDCMFVDALLEQGRADRPALAEGLKARLHRLGRSLSHDGNRLEGAALDERIAILAGTFVDEQLPRWRRLGALA